LPSFGATSVSQMAVSTASIWQKKGRMPWNGWCRQCWSNRAVSGVTCHWLGLGRLRQSATCWRISLMIGVGLYSCSAVEISSAPPRTISSWSCDRRRFFDFGTGVMNLEPRRLSTMRLVGWLSASSSQCRLGQA
jgi:hypothetical protein